MTRTQVAIAGLAGLALALTGVVGGVGSVAAKPASDGATVTMKENIKLADGGETAVLKVTVRCPAGATFSLSPSITQAQLALHSSARYDTTSSVAGTCAGHPQHLALELHPSTTDFGCPGCATYRVLLPTSGEAANWLATVAEVAFTWTTPAGTNSGTSSATVAIKG